MRSKAGAHEYISAYTAYLAAAQERAGAFGDALDRASWRWGIATKMA